MRKWLVSLVTVLAAIGVGLSAPTSPRASTTWCDNNLFDGVYHNYAGYSKVRTTPIPAGGGPSGNVAFKSATVEGTVAGWIGVQAVNGNWVQAGLYTTASGPKEFVEWNDGTEHFYPNLPVVSYGTAVTVSIVHVNTNGIWEATVDGHPILTAEIPGTWYASQYFSESQDNPTANSCNGADVRFSNTSNDRANMTNGSNLPDYVTNLGTNSWDSVAPYQTR